MPLGWNPGLYGAEERGRGEVETGGDVTGEGERLDETEVVGGSRRDGWMGAAREELGVWEGL